MGLQPSNILTFKDNFAKPNYENTNQIKKVANGNRITHYSYCGDLLSLVSLSGLSKSWSPI
jgi:hypothetical protein